MMKLRLRELRNSKKLKQTDLAEFLDIDRTTYSKYETGDNATPLDILIKLADYYDVTLDYLVGRTERPELVEKKIEVSGKNVIVHHKKSISTEELQEMVKKILLEKGIEIEK